MYLEIGTVCLLIRLEERVQEYALWSFMKILDLLLLVTGDECNVFSIIHCFLKYRFH